MLLKLSFRKKSFPTPPVRSAALSVLPLRLGHRPQSFRESPAEVEGDQGSAERCLCSGGSTLLLRGAASLALARREPGEADVFHVRKPARFQ